MQNIKNQAFVNTILTYLGFGIGAINVLFLYTKFLSQNEYGLVSYILSVSNILTPFLTLGVHTTIIRFFSSFNDEVQKNRFYTIVFFLPVFLIVLGGILTFFSFEIIQNLISQKNEMVGNFIWTMFLISALIAYFEVFFAWSKIHYKTIEGNFLKEVFPRLVTLILLVLIHIEWIDFERFIFYFSLSYFVRLLLMVIISFKIKMPKFSFALPSNFKEISKYSLYLLLASSVSAFFMDIDKIMLNQFVSLDKIAIYSVAVFASTIVAVPYRAFYQSISPLIAEKISKNEKKELSEIFKKSSNWLFWFSSLIFLLIFVNIKDFFFLFSPKYTEGIFVVYIISLVKLSDTLTCMSNAVLFNSNYYKWVLYLGVVLLFNTLILNYLTIPKWGINAAAISTLISFSIYNILKIGVVYKFQKLQPISTEIIKIIGLILGLSLFVLVDFSQNLLLNLVLRSIFVVILFVFVSKKLIFPKEIADFLLQNKIFKK